MTCKAYQQRQLMNAGMYMYVIDKATNGMMVVVKIATQHVVAAVCCIVNRDRIPSTIITRTSVPSVL